MGKYARFSIGVIILVFALSIAVSACSQSSSSPSLCEVSVPSPPASATPVEAEYAEWYEEITNKVYAAQDRFDEALENFKQNPTDKFQMVILARELVNFSSYHDEANEKKAPPSFDCVHKGLLRALQEYKTASDALEGGSADNFLDHIAKGKNLMFDAGTLYEQWKKGHK